MQLEILALRHQLAIYQHSVKRPKLQPADISWPATFSLCQLSHFGGSLCSSCWLTSVVLLCTSMSLTTPRHSGRPSSRRGVCVGYSASLSATGSGCDLRHRVSTTSEPYGHRRGEDCTVQSLAKSVCGESHGQHTARGPRSRHRAQRTASVPCASILCRVLSPLANTSIIGDGRASVTSGSSPRAGFGAEVVGGRRFASSL